VCVFEMHGLFAGSKLHRKALYRSIISMANMPSSLTHMLRACTTKVCRAIIVVHQSAARAQRVECIGCTGDMWPTVEHAMLAARISDQLTKSKILDTPDIEKARQVSAAAQRRVCRFAERTLDVMIYVYVYKCVHVFAHACASILNCGPPKLRRACAAYCHCEFGL